MQGLPSHKILNPNIYKRFLILDSAFSAIAKCKVLIISDTYQYANLHKMNGLQFTKMNLIFINNRHLGGSQTGILPLSKIPIITGTY